MTPRTSVDTWPHGPVPRLEVEVSDASHFEPVPLSDWKPLSLPGFKDVAAPPSLARERSRITEFEKAFPGYAVERKPSALKRLGPTKAVLPPIGEALGVEIDLTGQWTPGDFSEAYSRAWKTIRAAGFRIGARYAWIFRDAKGRWWVFHETTFCREVAPVDDPPCYRIPLTRLRLGTLGARMGRNAGSLPWGPRKRDLPEAFIADFGGPFGPLCWAFEVASVGRSNLARVRTQWRRQGRVQAMFRRPEWIALREALAVDWPHGGGLREELAILESEFSPYGVDPALGAFISGFQAGSVLQKLKDAADLAESEWVRGSKKTAKAWVAPALEAAIEERRKKPTISQEALATWLTRVGADKKSVIKGVPGFGTVLKAIRKWEQAGELPKPPFRTKD